jgi:Holliday junction DNA helicase RuvB
MEDFEIDIVIGKNGENTKSVRLDLPRFTLIGATTRSGLLSAPLRARFGLIEHMEYYTPEELKRIITASAKKLSVEIKEDGAMELAKRSRGTPRLANRLLKRVRDFAEIRYDGVITKEVADTSLELMQVDSDGLDEMDRAYLSMIIQNFGGGPAGLETLAASLGEDSGTLEDVCEPYLLKNGYVNRTPRGRVATKKAWEHMGLDFKDSGDYN